MRIARLLTVRSTGRRTESLPNLTWKGEQASIFVPSLGSSCSTTITSTAPESVAGFISCDCRLGVC